PARGPPVVGAGEAVLLREPRGVVRGGPVLRAERVPDHGDPAGREGDAALLPELLRAADAAHLPAVLLRAGGGLRRRADGVAGGVDVPAREHGVGDLRLHAVPGGCAGVRRTAGGAAARRGRGGGVIGGEARGVGYVDSGRGVAREPGGEPGAGPVVEHDGGVHAGGGVLRGAAGVQPRRAAGERGGVAVQPLVHARAGEVQLRAVRLSRRAARDVRAVVRAAGDRGRAARATAPGRGGIRGERAAVHRAGG